MIIKIVMMMMMMKMKKRRVQPWPFCSPEVTPVALLLQQNALPNSRVSFYSQKFRGTTQ
jgi:hypothetical protein